jgi:hypothetical protein
MQHHVNPFPIAVARSPWNKGKLTGAKPPLQPKHVWAIRTKLQVEGRPRDLAMFNLAIDSKLRGCDVGRPKGRKRRAGWIRSRSRDRPTEEDRTACQVRIDGADPRSGR